MKLSLYTKDQISEIVASSKNYLEVVSKLGFKIGSGGYIAKVIHDLNIDTSHFVNHGILLSDILVENSTYLKTGHLKNKLFKFGLKKPICEICGIVEWQGKPICFNLHHINGHHADNRLENLQVLCPNCHCQTDTYGIKNIGNGRNRKPRSS